MRFFLAIAFLIVVKTASASSILVPMDDRQTNHLKAYGVSFWVLENGVVMEWLLNYRGGSFLFPHLRTIEEELIIRGVSYEIVADGQVNAIRTEIANPEVNMEIVQLEKAPKIAVYTPNSALPWDDAVTMVLDYAEIPYDKIYDSAIVMGVLPKYDWLHLHHEDFTGQYGKFYASFHRDAWYINQVADAERDAANLGFAKVSQLKLAVANNLRNFVIGGGFLFTMCSGTDSFDIALAAHETDICERMFDGDPRDPNCQNKLDYTMTFAFKDFILVQDPMLYEYSNIDGTDLHRLPANQDKFTLFDFSAKWDVVPAMLTQCHTDVIDGFMGQTTDFRRDLIKSNVLVMGENKALNTARYIHGELGQGTWTFYGGHDPEDFQHKVGDPPTDLNLHPNSPGYRLILNNILFPAAKKQKRKT
ncbi:asparagine synthetase B [Fluviicola chungangensis]|uniref:Asparagine synthetase B n=1 Tax=Fluviicola chungangensis TaxID=2597671 RepID=A0A556MYQ0_9FLAO|nr:asparagine synthetase B [Fluviicola chungangensis]TSJ45044.1 asparagine synthetase B [Fluviicola chungangensis]